MAAPSSARKFVTSSHTNKLQSPHFDYTHSKIKCSYRSELFEPNKAETSRVKELIQRAVSSVAVSSGEKRGKHEDGNGAKRKQKIIIDTDIGTDADDILALLMALRMDDEVEILGVTTNYYPTKLRAVIAKTILKAAGREKIPVVHGCDHVCGTHRPFFHFGNEGCGMNMTKRQEEGLWTPTQSRDFAASKFIYAAVKRYPGEVVICAIGMATNIALCATMFKDFDGLSKRVVIMQGGSVLTEKSSTRMVASVPTPWRGGLPKSEDEAKRWMRWSADSKPDLCRPVVLFPNHNISGDTKASCMLYEFLQKTPVYVIPHYVTAKHWLREGSVAKLYCVGEKHSGVATDPLIVDPYVPPTDGTDEDRAFLLGASKRRKDGTVLVMCGTFNPPHRGHVDMIVRAKEKLGDRFAGVVVSVNGDEYVNEKARYDQALSFRHRKNMLEMMASDVGLGRDQFHVSSAEADKREMFYIEILQHFGKLVPDLSYRLLCGSDHGKHLVTTNLSSLRILIVKRSQKESFVPKERWSEWTKKSTDAVIVLNALSDDGIDLSSTALRAGLHCESSIESLKKTLSLFFTKSARMYFCSHLLPMYCPGAYIGEFMTASEASKRVSADDKDAACAAAAKSDSSESAVVNTDSREDDEAAAVSGMFLYQWLKRRGHVGQCPHDPLTLYEALYIDETTKGVARKFSPGRSCVRYARGTVVCHEWAGYLTFVPDPINGNHYLAVENISLSSSESNGGARKGPSAFSDWLDRLLAS